MQRIYRERKYKCGEYIEVSIYPVYTKSRTRGERRKPTTEIQQRLNSRHATDTLRRLLHTNFNTADLFVTLTFDDEHLPETVADCQKLIQNFLRRVKRKYGKAGLELKYIYIIEYGEKHDRLHAHLVINSGLNRDELSAAWGNGAVSSDRLRFDNDGLTALAVYLTKGSGDDKNRTTFKRWSGSRNLEKPIITERDGRISHKKMLGFCENGGDGEYLETQYNGYETVDLTVCLSADLYGGLYLSAMLKQMPIKNDLPFSTGQYLFDF